VGGFVSDRSVVFPIVGFAGSWRLESSTMARETRRSAACVPLDTPTVVGPFTVAFVDPSIRGYLSFDVFTQLRIDSLVIDPQRNRLLPRRKGHTSEVFAANFSVFVIWAGTSFLALINKVLTA
jgi:hypothetical protein